MKEVIATRQQAAAEDVVFLQPQGVCPRELNQVVQPLLQRSDTQMQPRQGGLRFTMQEGQGAAFLRSLQLMLSCRGIAVRAAL